VTRRDIEAAVFLTSAFLDLYISKEIPETLHDERPLVFVLPSDDAKGALNVNDDQVCLWSHSIGSARSLASEGVPVA
jgi:hypothetical protein